MEELDAPHAVNDHRILHHDAPADGQERDLDRSIDLQEELAILRGGGLLLVDGFGGSFPTHQATFRSVFVCYLSIDLILHTSR